MQYDMHYYGTYAMACAAGIPKEDAEIIAYCAQNVDDQNFAQIQEYEDGTQLHKVSTAHHPVESGFRSLLDTKDVGNDARHVWVPFHFLPGCEGDTTYEKMSCVKNSKVAKTMLDHYLELPYARNGVGLQLAGIAAHVYADTFSHYDFAGISTDRNKVNVGSIEYGEHETSSIIAYIKERAGEFQDKFAGEVASTSPLGHGPVNTLPDRPFLKFRFEFADGRSSGWRNNPETFLEACNELYGFFSRFMKQRYATGGLAVTSWESIEGTVKEILATEKAATERVTAWTDAMKAKRLGHVQPPKEYREGLWDNDADMNRRFHAAADYHRTYVLRFLLPSFGLNAV